MIDRLARLTFTQPEGPEAKLVTLDYFDKLLDNT